MPNRDPAAITEIFSLITHVLDIHPFGCISEVQMHIDINVKLTRQGEDAINLTVRVCVCIRSRTHYSCSLLECFDHKLISARIV